MINQRNWFDKITINDTVASICCMNMNIWSTAEITISILFPAA
jgi:hypothetical protein